MAQFLTDTQINSVYELYIGYFNRAPEAGGLNYWSNYYLGQVNAGKTDAAIQKDIANQFYSAAVQYNIYSAGTPVEDFIKASYLNALGRTSVDDAGMTYWTAKLTSGEVSRGEFVQKLISDAKGFASDATYGWVSKYLENRMAVAKAFAAANTTTGDAAITAGKAALSAVTPAAVQAGQTPAQALAAAAAAGFTSVAGNTFTLTTGADTLSPNSAVAANKTTSGDDLFRAVTANSLETPDAIDGGAGNDTLTANIAGNGTIAPILANIENVKLTTDTAPAVITAGTGAVTTISINLNTATGISTLTLAADGVNHAAATNITLGTKLVADDGATTGVGNIAFAFKAASVTGAADNADLTVQGKTDGGIVVVNSIENLALHSVAKSGVTAANSINLLADSAATLTIDGAKALTLATSAATEANLTGIDATAMTAGLTYANTGAVVATTSFSVKTGAGADTLTLVGAGNKLVVDTGAGNDTVNLTTVAATKGSAITTGAGVDTIAITATAANFAAADLTTAAKLDAAAIKVTDYVKGSDVLSFTGAAATAFQALSGTQLAAIADTSVNTDLLAAVNAAAAIANANSAVVFAYGGDTYLFVEDGGTAGLSVGDTLIKFVGVTDTLVNNVNFTIA